MPPRMLENVCYVYEHWRPDKNECFYVGKGSGKRYKSTIGRNTYHKAITEKLKRNGMCLEIRIIERNMSNDDALCLEIERIAYWRTLGIKLTNHGDGGDGMWGFRHSQETKAKMRAAALGRKISEYQRLEAARAQRERMKNPAAREKIRMDHLGRKHSEETRRKVSLAGMGRKPKPRTLEERRRHAWIISKPVTCITDGISFPSGKVSAEFYGVHASGISAVCKRNKRLATVRGMVFAFSSEIVEDARWSQPAT